MLVHVKNFSGVRHTSEWALILPSILSLIAGVFLPLGIATGLLGVNVGEMPGVEKPLAF